MGPIGHRRYHSQEALTASGLGRYSPRPERCIVGETDRWLVPEHARHPGQDLCQLAGMAPVAICDLLEGALRCLPWIQGPHPRRSNLLVGRTMVNIFNEPSTRTRASFELAARRLGSDVLSFTAGPQSSTSKGESLEDTLRNLDAMGIDAFVIRDVHEGLPRRLAGYLRGRVVNAGDGRGEHPTQGLIDLLAVVEAFDRPLAADQTLAGLTVVIVGDIDNGRVAHSDLVGFRALGARVVIAGPSELLKDEVAERHEVTVERDFDRALEGADVVVMLRIQRERLAAGVKPDHAAYHQAWGLTARRLAACAPQAVVLHPGPLNRGVEITGEVADGPNSRILRQVTLGVAVRMAVLARACGVEVPS